MLQDINGVLIEEGQKVAFVYNGDVSPYVGVIDAITNTKVVVKTPNSVYAVLKSEANRKLKIITSNY